METFGNKGVSASEETLGSRMVWGSGEPAVCFAPCSLLFRSHKPTVPRLLAAG